MYVLGKFILLHVFCPPFFHYRMVTRRDARITYQHIIIIITT